MPLKRKLIKVGNSRAVVIPPDWIEVYEEKIGQPIHEVLMEVNSVIVLSVANPDRHESSAPSELTKEANMTEERTRAEERGRALVPITEIAKGIFKIGPLATGNARTPDSSPHLIVGRERALIWEPGEPGQVPALLEGIRDIGVGLDRIAYIIASHIHLHHCAGAPLLLKEIPGATFMVHHRAIPYLVDPTRLNKSTREVWGDGCPSISPVPEKRIKGLHGGEVIDLGKRLLDIIDAPGHTFHLVAMFDRKTRSLFPGDAVGVLHTSQERARPDILPPLFDVEKAVDSVRRLRALKPKVIFAYGYGGVSHSPDKTMQWAEDDWREVERICREGMKQKKNSVEIGKEVTDYYHKVGIAIRTEAEEDEELHVRTAPYGMVAYLHKQDPSLEMPQRNEAEPLHGRQL